MFKEACIIIFNPAKVLEATVVVSLVISLMFVNVIASSSELNYAGICRFFIIAGGSLLPLIFVKSCNDT